MSVCLSCYIVSLNYFCDYVHFCYHVTHRVLYNVSSLLHQFPDEGFRKKMKCSIKGWGDLQLAWEGHASHHLSIKSGAGQLINASIIQSIGSLSRQMKAKVLVYG